MNVKALRLLAAGIIFAVTPITNDALADKFTFRIASGHSPSWHFVELAQTYFIPEVKKRVKEKTGHDIEFVEGFSGSVAKTNEVLEAVRTGVVDFGFYCICHEPTRLSLNNFPMYMPFGPHDAEVAMRATRQVYDMNPELEKQFERYGQRLIAIVPFEPYQIIARTPISKATEVKGRRIGAAGPNAFWVEHAGALPVSMPGPEMYTSLQTGLIDSMLIFLSVMQTLNLFDVAPNLIDISFGAMPTPALTVNSRRFGQLPKEVRDIIIEVGRDMEAKGGAFTNEVGKKVLNTVNKRPGVTIIQVSEDEKKAWAEMLVAGTAAIAKKEDSKAPMSKIMRDYYTATESLGHRWPAKAKLD
jgi:TRAP-type C4-dicarboxylate transport system substrate-binding protein